MIWEMGDRVGTAVFISKKEETCFNFGESFSNYYLHTHSINSLWIILICSSFPYILLIYMNTKVLQTFFLKKTILDQTIWDVRSFICVHATSNAHDSVYNFLLHLGGSWGFHDSISPRCKCTKINGVKIVVHWQWIGALCMENGWYFYYNEL